MNDHEKISSGTGSITISPDGIVMTGNATMSFKPGGSITFRKGDEKVVIDQEFLDGFKKGKIDDRATN